MTPRKFEETGGSAYSDWFGKGNTLQDYHDVVAENGRPDEVLTNDKMVVCIYWDKIIVKGYDGGKYCHEFMFFR